MKKKAGMVDYPGTCQFCGKALPIPRNFHCRSHPKCKTDHWNKKRRSSAEHLAREKAYRKKYWADLANREKFRAAGRSRTKRIRLLVVKHYGGKCACCGETTLEFLAIDHIDGDGNSHRRKTRRRGTAFYAWLVRNNFPPGFRVLCHNCNVAIGLYGSCPHNNL